MAMDHAEIIKQFGKLRSNATAIVQRSRNATENIGGVADNKPSARAVNKLETEILRLRTGLDAAYTAFLAAIDA